ncbi:MAG: hypothetical protein AB7V62_15540 [Thermoleophilia bacterium]
MMNRRQAVIGYVTYRVARRLARREAHKRVSGVGRADQGGSMFRNGKTSAAADRAGALYETVRPIVTKAMQDPELHEAIRQAFATGKQVQGEIAGKPPSKAARKIANDRKLQKKVETSATDLQKAVSGLVEKPKKKGRIKSAVGKIAVIGAVGGTVFVVVRKLRGGGAGDTPV